jgi:hypothetical protein
MLDERLRVQAVDFRPQFVEGRVAGGGAAGRDDPAEHGRQGGVDARIVAAGQSLSEGDLDRGGPFTGLSSAR